MAQYLGWATNNVSELSALQLLLSWLIQNKEVRKPVLIVYTDSQYMQGVCLGTKKATANKELVNTIRDLIRCLKIVGTETKIEWVRAHSDNELNNLVDLLAKYATHYTGAHEKYNGVQAYTKDEFLLIKQQLKLVTVISPPRGPANAPSNPITGVGSQVIIPSTVQPVANADFSEVPSVL
jgi:ribonuclease HI